MPSFVSNMLARLAVNRRYSARVDGARIVDYAVHELCNAPVSVRPSVCPVDSSRAFRSRAQKRAGRVNAVLRGGGSTPTRFTRGDFTAQNVLLTACTHLGVVLVHGHVLRRVDTAAAAV